MSPDVAAAIVALVSYAVGSFVAFKVVTRRFSKPTVEVVEVDGRTRLIRRVK
jgi:hypothetical protein